MPKSKVEFKEYNALNLKTGKTETYKVRTGLRYYTNLKNAIARKAKVNPVWIKLYHTFSSDSYKWEMYEKTTVKVGKYGDEIPRDLVIPCNDDEMGNVAVIVRDVWKLNRKDQVMVYYPPIKFGWYGYEWKLY
jgi:hypothetical protein